MWGAGREREREVVCWELPHALSCWLSLLWWLHPLRPGGELPWAYFFHLLLTHRQGWQCRCTVGGSLFDWFLPLPPPTCPYRPEL